MMKPTMHLMFGIFDPARLRETSGFDAFRRGVEVMFDANARVYGTEGAKIGLTGNGRLSGAARDGDSCLILLGVVQKPLPRWSDGSPLDDPNATAKFLLNRYREQGVAFLDGTVGAFVVALWDAKEGRCILANDPGGMRTAYYTTMRGRFAFSSTLYALNCTVDGGLAIDRSLEDFLLGYEFLPWQRTIYENVFSLAPGMILEWKNGIIRQHSSLSPDCSAYRLDNLAGSNATEEQAGEALYDLFMRCLEDVLPSDEKVAVLLGGFDSALVTAACRKLGKAVDTYTFRFPEARFNQAYAEETAQLCGARHHWIDIDPEVLREGLSEYPLLFNQPSGMPHYLVQTAHVLRRMREEGHTHCLTGDGCDEIFLGYPTVYRRARFFQRLRSLPHWATKTASWILRQRAIEDFFGQAARFTRNFLNIAGRPYPRRGHISNRILDEYSLGHLRKDTPTQAVDSEVVLTALSLGLEGTPQLRLAYHGKSMPGLNKTKLAGVSSVTGLTVLSPFQHPQLVAYAQSLPEQMLRPLAGGVGTDTGKRVLMRAVENKGLLPPKVIYQKKASPIAGMADNWYMGPLNKVLLAQMESLPFPYDRFFARGLLRFRMVEELFRRKVSLGSYILNAPALLATYATFNDPRSRGCGKLSS